MGKQLLNDDDFPPGTPPDEAWFPWLTPEGERGKTRADELPGSGGGGGGGDAPVAAEYAIEEIVIVGSSTNKITFEDFPSTYRDLHIEWTAKSTYTSANDVKLKITFNDDDGNNYDVQQSFLSGGNLGGGRNTGQNNFYGPQLVSSASGTPYWDSGDLIIGSYAEDRTTKALRGLTSNTENGGVRTLVYTGHWKSSAAITKIEIELENGNFVEDSVFTLYGRGGLSGGTGGDGSGGFADFNTPMDTPTEAMWRVRIAGTASHNDYDNAGFGEVKFLDGSGTNLATGGTPFASSADYSSWPPSEAFDGQNGDNNGWYSGNNRYRGLGEWLAYSFTAPVLPVQVSVCPLNNHPNSIPKAFAVDVYHNNRWVEVGVFSTAPGSPSTYQTFDIPQTITAAAIFGFPSHPLYGQPVLAIGDSITAASAPNNWTDYLEEITGCVVTKVATSGYVMQQCLDQLQGTPSGATGFQTVLVHAGVNDYYNSTAIGTISDTESSNTFMGSINGMIQEVLTDNPQARLIFFTPTIRTDVTAANGQGKVLKDYRDAIIQCCEAKAIPFLDLWAKSGFNTHTINTFTSDQLHPNGVGAERIGRIAANFTQSI